MYSVCGAYIKYLITLLEFRDKSLELTFVIKGVVLLRCPFRSIRIIEILRWIRAFGHEASIANLLGFGTTWELLCNCDTVLMGI